MTDLLSESQVQQIRDVFHDLSETFAFPITVRKTTYTNAAFRTTPTNEDHPFNAIREFRSNDSRDQFRNDLGADEAHEVRLYVHWKDFEDEGLIDSENKVLLDHNDLVIMEDEEYEIVSFGGIAEMSKKPSFVYIFVKRKWANADED